MTINFLDLAQKLAQGARAKAVEDRQRLAKLQAQPANGQRQTEMPSSGR
jgi:hypothetical protein